MNVETGFANVNGTRLYYEVAGSGHRLVLIHGSSTDTRMWDDQFGPFSEQYRVIRYDMRGHGRSALPTEEPYRHAEDLKGLLEYLDIERAHVTGLSSGGTAVIDFALLFPDKTAALMPVSSGPTGRRSGPSSTKQIDAAIREAFKESGKRAATELAYQHPVFSPAVQNPRAGARMKQYLDEADFWRMSRKDPGMTDLSQVDRLGEIDTPALVIMGELDVPEMGPATDAFRDGVAGAQKVVMLGCGHMVNMEDPETFNRTMLDFLAGV